MYYRTPRSTVTADVKVTLKIFLILGLTWTFDIIAFIIEPFEQTYIGVEILVIIFLIINASHGMIFFCVVFGSNSTKNRMFFGRRNLARTLSHYYSTFRSTTSSRGATRTTSTGTETLTKGKEGNAVSIRLRTLKNQRETFL